MTYEFSIFNIRNCCDYLWKWFMPFYFDGWSYFISLDIFFYICPDHDIVASFYLKKPFYLLEDNLSQLKEDIWNEIGFSTTKVSALSYFLNYILHISIFLLIHFFEPGCYLISGIQRWIKHNKGSIWGWSWCKIFWNIPNYSKFDQGKFCFFGDTTIFSSPECIPIWGTICFWGAKIPRRNYYSPPSESISFAESTNPFQFYLKLLHLWDTIKFWWTEEPAEVGITSGTLWGLTISFC